MVKVAALSAVTLLSYSLNSGVQWAVIFSESCNTLARVRQELGSVVGFLDAFVVFNRHLLECLQ